jgi:CheY-like chemotaxis protein
MPLSRNKVMIIGDDAVSLYVITELLMDKHLDVVPLRLGPGTASLVRSVRPNLILLDNSMSASAFLAITEALGQDEETRSIPLLKCSAADGDGLRKRVLRYRTSGCTGRGDACRWRNTLERSLEGFGL